MVPVGKGGGAAPPTSNLGAGGFRGIVTWLSHCVYVHIAPYALWHPYNGLLMQPLTTGRISAKKRLFVGLILATSLVVSAVMLLLWIIPTIGFANMTPVVPILTGVVFAGVALVFVAGAVGLALCLWLGRPLPFFRQMHGMNVRLYLPLMTLLGQAVGIPKDVVRASFIKVNNEFVLWRAGSYDPDRILILTPHCLQKSVCGKRLTHEVDHCARCSLCTVGGLLDLRDHYGVHFAIATGGTIARRIVVQKRPKLIVAVACERDLTSGIQDTWPLPVYGVLNERPHGPCLDTRVQLEAVEEALRTFIRPDKLAEPLATTQGASATDHKVVPLHPQTSTNAVNDRPERTDDT